MLQLTRPKKCKFIVAFIYAAEETYAKALHSLKKKFGRIDFESSALSFDFTDYYREEMGSGLKRRFISFKKLVKPSEIVEAKLFCVRLEKRLAIVGKRRINIDPGYLNEAKVVLSTTKDFSHRIYLGKKIFAEVTLIYRDKAFRNLAWTFPDYKTRAYKDILVTIRNLYKENLKKPAK